MKTTLNFLVPVAIAILALVSCQKETDVKVVDELGTVHITVKASANDLQGETRTYIDDNKTIIWGTGEYMKIAVTGNGTEENPLVHVFGDSNDDSADAWEGDPEALFEFDITPDGNAPYLYQGLYPASSAVPNNDHKNEDPTKFKVNLPSTQNATASSYDPSAYIMVAKPESFDNAQTEWEASYRRATALNKVTLKNIPEDIVSVEFTAPSETYLAGRRYINLSTGESGEIYKSGSETETIKVNVSLTGTEKTVWFTSWGAVIPAGSILKIVAKSATKSYTREITANTNGISFKEGYLNTLSVNMASADVEVLDDVTGKYLIGYKSSTGWILMNPVLGSNKYYPVQNTSVTTDVATVSSGDFSSVPNLDGFVWDIAKYDGAYSIKSVSTSNYLALTKSSNEAHSAEELSVNTKFSITIDSESKVATIESTAFAGRILKYNSGSPRFAFYTSGQQSIYLIPVDNRTSVTLSFAEAEICKTTDNYQEFTGQVVTATPTVEGIIYSVDGDDIVSSWDSSTGAITLSGSAGTSTVTASFAGDEHYRPATASYTIIVTEEGGEQWVLVESATDVDSGDYVITWNNTYFLPNSTQGKKFPVGTGITVSGSSLANVVTNEMIWTFTGNNTEGFTVSAGTICLQAANSSDGISVVQNPSTKSLWRALDDVNNGMLLRGNDGGTRNAAVYNNEDWRYYQTGSNYTGTLRLYKRADNTEWTLNSIAITTEPAKTTYTVGESFDPTGMVVTAYYVDAADASHTKEVVLPSTDLTITPSGALDINDTFVTVSYNGKSATQVISVTAGPKIVSWSRSGSTNTITDGYELIANGNYPGANSGGYYQDAGTAGTQVNYLILQSTNRASALFTSTPTSVVLRVSLRGGSAKDPMEYPLYAYLIDANGDEISSTQIVVTSKATASFTDYEVTIPINGVTSAYGVKISHLKESSWNLRYAGMTLTIE